MNIKPSLLAFLVVTWIIAMIAIVVPRYRDRATEEVYGWEFHEIAPSRYTSIVLMRHPESKTCLARTDVRRGSGTLIALAWEACSW